MAPSATSTASAPAASGNPVALGEPGYHLPVRSFADDAYGTTGIYTTSNGVAVPHPYASQRVGQDGPLLLQDHHLVDLLSHFDRERIPERVVHAKGGGAHGKFTCTHPIPHLSVAKLFGEAGKVTPVTVRFSTVGGESGSPDCARDPRGFSIKFRTEEGNMDWVFNNTPVFFLRDPAKFPNFIHTQKRHPVSHATHGDDSTQFWDYMGNNPESVHQFMYLFGPRGIPKSWREMQGYSGHTFKFINEKSEWVYVQIHVLSQLGTKNLTSAEAAEESPDAHQIDLFNAIEQKSFPKWDICFQQMTQQQQQERNIPVFDLTKTWSRKDFPLQPLGELELNTNVSNYFAEMEQVAFNPAHLVPGMEPSADPVLQSRLFSYPDAHRHRVGVNYQQIPVNQPLVPIYNFQRDGAMAFYNQGSRQLHLSSLAPPSIEKAQYDIASIAGYPDAHAINFLSTVTPADFEQPRELYRRVFTQEEREALVEEVAGHMGNVKQDREDILARAIAVWGQVDEDLGAQLAKKTGIKSYAKSLKEMRFIGSNHPDMLATDAIRQLKPVAAA